MFELFINYICSLMETIYTLSLSSTPSTPANIVTCDISVTINHFVL